MPLLKPPRGTQLNKAHPLARGLSAFWLMNEGVGARIGDATGQHPITAGAMHWGTGIYGPMFAGDGANYYLNTGWDATAELDAVTVHMLVRARGSGESDYFIDQSSGSTGFGVRVSYTNSRVEAFAYEGSQAEVLMAYNINVNQWYTLTFVACSSYQRLYVDGLLKDSKGPRNSIDDSPCTLVLGAETCGFGSRLNGDIALVALYLRGLTQSEVVQLSTDPFQMFRYPCPVELFTYVEPVGDVTVLPDALSLTATLHDLVVALSLVASPSTLATAVSLEVPSVSVSVTQEVSALSLDATLPETVVRSDVTIEPSALSLSTTLPAPQVNYDCGVAVDAAELSLTLPAPTVVTGQGVLVSAGVLSLDVTVHAPALAYDIQQAASALALTSTVRGPEVTAGTIMPVGCQSMTAAVQAPGVTYDCQFAVDAVGFAVSVELADTSYTCSVTPASMPLTAAVETPVVLYGTIVQAAVQQLQSAIGSVQVAYDFGQSVSVLAMTTQLPSVAVTADTVLDAETQSLHGTVIEPTLSTALFQVAWALNLWEK